MPQTPDLAVWLDLFRSRRLRLLPAAQERSLSPAERVLIARSIATFQLGESSEGTHLIAAARALARRAGTPELVELTTLFIREEQFHAAMLGALMDRNGIPRLRSQYSDRVFRVLRRPFGFDLALRVLVTAELIAMTYYRALAMVTGSAELKSICAQLLADEEIHLRYEQEVVSWAASRRGRALRLLAAGLHRCLLAAAVLVVYAGHGKVLRAAGFGFTQFWTSCWWHHARWREAPIAAASLPADTPRETTRAARS